MASVRKRRWTNAKGEACEAWIVDYKDEKGKRRSGGSFELKKDADSKKRQIENELERGTHTPDREAPSLKELVGQPNTSPSMRPEFGKPLPWLAHCERRERIGDRMSPSRLAQLKGAALKHIVPEFGLMKVNKITPAMVQEWIDGVADSVRPNGKPYKRRTLELLVETLDIILDYAVKTRQMKRNPVADARGTDAGVKVPAREEPPPAFLEASEVAQLLRWAMLCLRTTKQSTHVWRSSRMLVLLAIFTGMREGEICALDWKRVHLKEWTIDVHYTRSNFLGIKGLKSGDKTRRSVPINPILHAALEAHWENYGRPKSGMVVLNDWGEPIVPRNVSGHYWPRICEQSGLVNADGSRPYTFHDLRHAAGSFWLADGMPLEEVSRLLGHIRLDTTRDIYIHQLKHDERALRAIEKMTDRFVRMMDGEGVQLIASERPPLLLEPPRTLPALPIETTPANGSMQHACSMADEDLLPWQRRVLELSKAGVTIRKMAREVHKGQGTIALWLEERGLYQRADRTPDTPPEVIERALQLWANDVPCSHIAQEAGVSETTVRGWAARAGLPKREPGERHLFSKEQRARALEMWAEELPSAEIGAAVGASGVQVTRWAREAGLPPRGAGWKPPGKRPRGNPKFTPEQRAEALAMWIDDRPSTEIGAVIGASAAMVVRWALEAGLPPRGQGWKQPRRDVAPATDAAPVQHDPLEPAETLTV